MTEQGGTLKDLLQAAEQAQKSGDTGMALRHYAQILAKAPNHSKARKAVQKIRRDSGAPMTLTQGDVDLVIRMLTAGDFQSAADQCQLLIFLAPKEALVYNILGMAESNLARFNHAVAAFTKATKINPNYAEAYGNLGSAMIRTGQMKSAAIQLEKALSINPNLVEAYNNLAAIQRHQGRYTEALETVDKALARKPDYANAYNTKGTIYRDMNMAEEARGCFEKGLELDPTNADMKVNLGYNYAQLGDFETAVATLESALPHVADPSDATHKLGVILGQMGRKDEAIATLQSAIAKNPSLADGYRALSTLKKFAPGDPLIDQMQTAFDAPDCTPEGRMHLGFALGKAYEDTGDYAKAFQCLAVGNAEKRKIVLPYSTEVFQARLDKIKAFFTPEFAAKMAGVASDSEKLIFVVGMNRSGTTLVEQILASHSQVYGAGELTHLDHFAQRHEQALEDITPEIAATFIKEHLALLDHLSDGAPRVTDKLPINFKWIGLIKALFPKAKIINLQRDPRDNCLSIFKNYFDTTGNQYAYDLTELAEFYVMYRDMMDHWHQIYPGEIYDCVYEDLTADQEGKSRKMLAYCGLDWEDGVLDFHKTKRNVQTASVSQVRQKMYQSSVKSWQHFEAELAPLIDVLRAAGRLPQD